MYRIYHILCLICVGKGVDDIVVGYQDGTVIVYSVHPEFFSSTENYGSNSFDAEHSFDFHGGFDPSCDNENLAIVEEFSITLPFSIVGLAYGSFLNENGPAVEQAGTTFSGGKVKNPPVSDDEDSEPGDGPSIPIKTQDFFREQLAVLTKTDFRLFVNR
jgi:hypothetical protein